MNRNICLYLAIVLLSSCVNPPKQSQLANRAVVDSLNQQIEQFNTNRMRDPNMGISPLERRVSRVVYSSKLDQITSYDQDDNSFIILKREQDGGFKGVLEQPYHQAAFTGPGGSHSWGNVLAEFYIKKEMF